jgi:hypothetical protein
MIVAGCREFVHPDDRSELVDLPLWLIRRSFPSIA